MPRYLWEDDLLKKAGVSVDTFDGLLTTGFSWDSGAYTVICLVLQVYRLLREMSFFTDVLLDSLESCLSLRAPTWTGEDMLANLDPIDCTSESWI